MGVTVYCLLISEKSKINFNGMQRSVIILWKQFMSKQRTLSRQRTTDGSIYWHLSIIIFWKYICPSTELEMVLELIRLSASKKIEQQWAMGNENSFLVLWYRTHRSHGKIKFMITAALCYLMRRQYKNSYQGTKVIVLVSRNVLSKKHY